MRSQSGTGISRRRFAIAAGCTLAGVALGEACFGSSAAPATTTARLTARPRRDAATTLQSGALGLGGDRDGVIQMPSTAAAGPLPLLVFLHGATQNGAGMLRRIGPPADAAGIVVLAPDSRATTWDAIRGGFGADIEFLNRALEHVFARVAIDPARVAVGGFSDGASYALSLGLANGDLFSHVVAFSPGFVIPTQPLGRTHFFVSHGINDQILPIEQCSRAIVPRLRQLGYDVTYREFEGRHEVPAAIATEGLRSIIS